MTENNRKKKILLIIDSLLGGGAELVVANLCRYVDQNRFDVSVCTLKTLGTRGDELKKEGYNVFELQQPRCLAERYVSSLKLRRIVRDSGIDLIHSHSTQGLVDGGIVTILNRRVRHIHTFHFGNYPHLDRKALLLERIFSLLPDQLVAVGERQKRMLESTFHLRGTRIEKIWNGIEIATNNEGNLAQSIVRRPEDGQVIIGSISTLIEQKGIPYFLDAIALLGRRRRDFRVWIVGDGPLRRELEEKSVSLGLSDLIDFVGWVHNAPMRILPQFDIFVQSSLWEAMSMVVLEAMAAGKAVVVTDVGDNRHLIENGRNGIIVPQKDPQKMAQEIERLILDKGLREELGKNALRKVIADCSVRRMARNYEQLYLNVLGKRS